MSEVYTELLEFMLNFGTDVNAVVEVPKNIQGKKTLLHIASLYCQWEVIWLIVERRADINIRNAKHELHFFQLLFREVWKLSGFY